MDRERNHTYNNMDDAATQGRNIRYTMQHQASKCKRTGGNGTRGTPAKSTGRGGRGGPPDGTAGQARGDQRDPRGDQRAASEAAGAREPAPKEQEIPGKHYGQIPRNGRNITTLPKPKKPT